MYTELFGGHPVKSYPNFAANGYDVANYFIVSLVDNAGDFNRGFSKNSKNSLQSVYDFKRVNNWGGFMNTAGYMLKYNPGGKISKVLLK